MNEFDLIARYFTPLSGAGALQLTDDAALLAGGRVIAKDVLVEGVHFLPHSDPTLLARKLLRVNLSDMAAMGAVPESYLLGLALPKDTPASWFEAFARGLAEDQRQFNVTLLGGDTTSHNGALVLSLTMIGRADAPVRRNAAQAGDALYVSGTLGDAALGLLAAQGQLAASQHAEYLVGRYLLPQPRVRLGCMLCGVATAMMDISDGLLGDASHISAASGVKLVIESEKLPYSAAARQILQGNPHLAGTVFRGGDDYELLFTASAGEEGQLSVISEETGVSLTRIGHVEQGSGVVALDASGAEMKVEIKGYSHF